MQANKYHYVYKITNLNPTDSRKFYIGVRSSSVVPEQDTSYMGSSVPLNESIKFLGSENFLKEILSGWPTREEANVEEIRLHDKFNVDSNNDYYNLAKASSTEFGKIGKVAIIDKRTGNWKTVDQEEYILNHKFYDAPNKNMVAVIDTRDNKNKRVSKEDHRKYDHYISVAKGSITVLDKRDNNTKRVSTKEYHNNKHFILTTENKINVWNIHSGETIYVSQEEFNKSDCLVGLNTGKVTVFDTKDNKNKNIPLDKFYSNKQRYIQASTNTVVVLDTRDTTTKRVSSDEYKKYNHYHSTAKGKVNALDKRIGKIISITVDEFQKHSYYEGATKDFITALDTRTNKYAKIPKLDYELKDYYVNPNAKKIVIFNTENEKMFVSYGHFKETCDKNSLPYGPLMYSYKNGGTPIYQNSNKRTLSQLRNSNKDKFIGWYAKLV